MVVETTTMSSKGQIVIPAGTRKRLGLIAKERFEIWDKDGLIIMKPIVKFSELMGKYKVPNATKKLLAMREEDERLENEKLKRLAHVRV